MKKVILIFGASSGIGYYTAKYQLGNTIYNVSRKECDIKGVDNTFCNDISKINVENIIKSIKEKEGKIDCILYSIGWAFLAPSNFAKEEDYRYLFEINFFCYTKVVKAAINLLQNCKIIIVASIAGVLALPYQSFYSASKAAIIQYTKALRHEVKNIQISACLPGGVDTSFTFNRKYYDEHMNDPCKRAKKKIIQIEQGGMSPKKVAKKICKMFEKKKIPATFSVGFSNKTALFMQKILPQGLIEKIMGKTFSVK